MFGIGSTELLIILVVALIVLGPKSLAGLSRSLGKAMGEFRRVSTDFQRTLNAEAAEEELKEKRKKREDAAKQQSGAYSPPQTSEFHDKSSFGPEEGFDGQMERIGKWERPNPDFMPDSPLNVAVQKARAEARAAAENCQPGPTPASPPKGFQEDNPHA